MTDLPLPSHAWRFGARSSQLSIVQSGNALRLLEALVPGLSCEQVPMTSPGDEDRKTDLRVSDPDFFTRYLDEAVRDGQIDAAVHSAKDLPDPVAGYLDWFWLPWREDPRDALILRPGETVDDLPEHPVAGVSSDRRDQWTREHFPGAVLKPIRGNIEHRLEQLDRGDFDLLLMAGAALNRLGMQERITQWLTLDELPAPAGQGYLAVTFRAGDERFLALRQLMVPAVTLLSAGPGDPGLCPQAGIEALRAADVCLYDALAPAELLAELPPHAQAIFVGKRRGDYSVARGELERMMTDFCRQGKRVVRLKGGDAGVFGRLAQEIEQLAALQLPYRVIPGVSSLQAATTGTGLLLTRKGVSRGFTAVTPEQLSDDAGVGMENRAALPLALFMAVGRLREVTAELIAEGRPADEPATMVLGASTPAETLLHGTLSTIAAVVEAQASPLPGLLLIGRNAAAQYVYSRDHFALGGQRVLLTCSERVMPDAVQAVHDFGGRPLPLPMVRLVPDLAADLGPLRDRACDWVVLTSPSAVDCLLEVMAAQGVDIRLLPRLLHCGAGTAAALARHGLLDTVGPAGTFSGEAMLATAREVIKPGDRVLRLRSDLAPTATADTLADLGATVTDVVLYHNEPVVREELPPFDAVCLASGSAAAALVDQTGLDGLAGKTVAVIGEPTARRLRELGREPDVIAPEATMRDTVLALAVHRFQQWLASR